MRPMDTYDSWSKTANIFIFDTLYNMDFLLEKLEDMELTWHSELGPHVYISNIIYTIDRRTQIKFTR